MAETKRPGNDRVFPDAGSAKQGFRQANPEQFGRANDLDTIRRLAAVEVRAADIKERLRGHVARHEKLWITNEAGRLLEKRAAASVAAPPVKNSAQQVLANVTQEAQRNVQVRFIHRMLAVNAAKARMQNTIIRSTVLQPRKPAQENRPHVKNAFRKANRLKT